MAAVEAAVEEYVSSCAVCQTDVDEDFAAALSQPAPATANLSSKLLVRAHDRTGAAHVRCG